MADAHQDATRNHEWRCCKAVFFGAKQGRNHYVATGLHLAVNLNRDAATQTVDHQGLLCFGKAQFPRCSGVL